MIFLYVAFFLSNLPDLVSTTESDARHIHIINPDADARENYDFVLNIGNSTLHNDKFSNAHIEIIRNK